MAPTLLVGDVIIADTWAYQKTTPLPNDIAIIKRSVNSKVLVKRVSKIRSNQYQTEIFIEGDNKKHSVDSHTYGWITDDYLIGKVKFVWVSLTNIKRNFVSAK